MKGEPHRPRGSLHVGRCLKAPSLLLLPLTVCCLLNNHSFQDGDFCLAESTAILRYLCDTRSVADHWYPRGR